MLLGDLRGLPTARGTEIASFSQWNYSTSESRELAVALGSSRKLFQDLTSESRPSSSHGVSGGVYKNFRPASY